MRLAKRDHLTGIVFQEVDSFRHVVVRLGPLFTLFKDLPCSEFIEPLASEVGRFDEIGGSLSGIDGAPVRKRLFGGRQGLFGLGLVCLADRTNDLLWIGWIEGVQC